MAYGGVEVSPADEWWCCNVFFEYRGVVGERVARRARVFIRLFPLLVRVLPCVFSTYIFSVYISERLAIFFFFHAVLSPCLLERVLEAGRPNRADKEKSR